ncbi:MAG: hypothetical protein RLP15_13565 [Cryomorphaceae bacterium]
MELELQYHSRPTVFLIRVIEQSEDFRPEAVVAAKQVLRQRNPSHGDLLKAAREVMTERINTYLDGFSVVNDALVLPQSHFLNEEEVKLVFRACFSARKGEFDDMIPEAWKYVLGA